MLICRWLCTFFILVCAGIPVYGQGFERDTPSDTTSRVQPGADSGGILDAVVDSLIDDRTYATAIDFYHIRPVLADSLNYLTHQYDETRTQLIGFGHLGNLGSPARKQFYALEETKGLDYGQHQFDLYRRTFADFRFFDAERAITEFSYSQGFAQADAKFEALFGKNFANGIKTSVEYRRINQTGLYTNQRVKNTNLGVGVWYDAPGGFYDGLYHYSSNSFVQLDNGGIVDYDDIDSLPQRDIVPVKLAGAQTTHRERAFSAQNHFHLVRAQSDTAKSIFVDLIHTAQYKNGFIKFSDTDVEDDAEYYGSFLTDARGVRHFLDYKTVDNRLDLQFRYGTTDLQDIAPHVLRAGLQYRFTSLNQEPERRNVNEVFLNVSGRTTLLQNLSIRGRGYLALAGQTGDYLIQAEASYAFRNFATFSAEVVSYLRSPNILEQKLYVAQGLIWDTDFNKFTHNELTFKANFERWRLYAQGSVMGLSNILYFDTDRMVRQSETTNGIAQVMVVKEFNFWKFGFAGKFAWQETPDQLRLPSLIGEGQLYFDDRWFRDNLQVRFGVDLRVTDTYDGVNFFPLTGQFHLDDTRRIESYPALDMYAAFQVRETFRAYVKFENFTPWFYDGQYFQVVDYPQFDLYFRFGFWLKLFN